MCAIGEFTFIESIVDFESGLELYCKFSYCLKCRIHRRS